MRYTGNRHLTLFIRADEPRPRCFVCAKLDTWPAKWQNQRITRPAAMHGPRSTSTILLGVGRRVYANS